MEKTRWDRVAEKCLDRALALLEKETALTIETVEAVRGLTKTAIAVSKVGCDSPIGPGTTIRL